MREISIQIGGIFASREPAVVRTVLGSCVSACLFDPVAGIGGMNHFMLPEGNGDSGLPARYGVHAMEMLINQIMKLGGERRRLMAKVFGAGHVLRIQSNGLAVPEQNALFIKAFLATERISILAQRLGGTQPLQVLFFTNTGKAWVKAVGGDKAKDLAEEERRYGIEIVKQVERPPEDNVILF